MLASILLFSSQRFIVPTCNPWIQITEQIFFATGLVFWFFMGVIRWPLSAGLGVVSGCPPCWPCTRRSSPWPAYSARPYRLVMQTVPIGPQILALEVVLGRSCGPGAAATRSCYSSVLLLATLWTAAVCAVQGRGVRMPAAMWAWSGQKSIRNEQKFPKPASVSCLTGTSYGTCARWYLGSGWLRRLQISPCTNLLAHYTNGIRIIYLLCWIRPSTI